MAVEQDALSYNSQAFVALDDSLLGPKANGAGIRALGSALFARRVAGGPFVAEGAAVLGNGPINTETAPTYAGVWFGFDGGANVAAIQAMNASSATLAFYTKPGSGQASAERARITPTGELLIGTTGQINGSYGSALNVNAVGLNGIALKSSASAWSGATFWNSAGTLSGSIGISGSSTSYNTSSDHRLKTNFRPLSGALDRIKALPVYLFDWIDGAKDVRGFKAHEYGEIIPGAATGEKDGMREEVYEIEPARPSDVLGPDGAPVMIPAVMGTRLVPDYQGIDQSKAVPDLVGAVQELAALVEALSARVAELEAAQ